MHETRRDSNGDLLGPYIHDGHSYDDAQIAGAVPARVIEVPDTLEGRIEVFLNRWHWRGSRDVVRRELVELIEGAK